jgi:hypothetical protein
MHSIISILKVQADAVMFRQDSTDSNELKIELIAGSGLTLRDCSHRQFENRMSE